jgi:hypothetical protein
MGRFINSFEIDVPPVTADLYNIDPQPNDNYPLLNAHATILEKNIGGRARWYNQGDRHYIAVIGAEREYATVRSAEGAELEFAHEAVLDFSKWSDFKVLQEALIEDLKQDLEASGYWYDSTKNTFYREDRETQIEGYDIYPGIEVRISYHDRPLITLDPTLGAIGSRTLADYLNDDNWGINRVNEELVGRTFLYQTSDRTSCTVTGVFENTTVSEVPPGRFDNETLNEIEDRHGREVADKVDPSEPTVKIRYGNSDWYPAAPSLLLFAPSEDRPDDISQQATFSPQERWEKVEAFREQIGNISIGTIQTDISQSPVRDGISAYGYPVLTFGDDPSTEMGIGRPNISFDGSPLTQEYWNPAKQGYLEEVGPRRTFDQNFNVAVLFPEGAEDDALSAYQKVREYVEDHLGLILSDPPGRVNYEDPHEVKDWQQSLDNIDAGFGYIPQHDEEVYHKLIEILDGKPLQSLTAANLRSAQRSGHEGDVIANTAVGLGVKLGVIPFSIENQLDTDAYLGLSVTGRDRTVASGVIVSGTDNQILYQTEQPNPTGRSTVTNQGLAKQILIRAVQGAVTNPHSEFEQLNSLTIHRNGYLGDEEIAGLREGVEYLKSNGFVTDSFEWIGVDVQHSPTYRIYDDDGMPDMGSYAQLDDETVLLLTTDAPRLDQGTPQPILCKIAVQEGDFDIYSVGRDAFYLSELNWGSPSKGIKDPLTVYLTRRMNRRLSHDRVSRLSYPPF